MSADIALDKAELVSMFLQSLLYGGFLVLYFATIYTLVYRRTTARLNIPLFATATAMFMLSTIHISIDLSRLIDAFITHGRDHAGGALAYYGLINNWKHVFKSIVYCVQTLIGDSFVAYRTYVVWGRRPIVIILPVVFVIGTFASSIGLCIAIGSAPPDSDIFSSGINPWVKALFAITLTTNVLCTSLIAFRIISISHSVAESRVGMTKDLAPIVIIVVESGAMYSCATLAMLIVYELGSNAQYIVLDATFPIIGITFALIIVRIGLNLTQDSGLPTTTTPVGFKLRSTNSHHIRPILAVNVTRIVQEHADSGHPSKQSDGSSTDKVYDLSGDQGHQ